jgi:hypothetical protein
MAAFTKSAREAGPKNAEITGKRRRFWSADLTRRVRERLSNLAPKRCLIPVETVEREARHVPVDDSAGERSEEGFQE